MLLLAGYDEPAKDLAAATLAGLCKGAGVAFDAYYAAARGGGGLFSTHGSLLIGGRHGAMIARALAQFETTVVRLGGVAVFDSLVRVGAARVIEATEGAGDLISLYATVADALGVPFPSVAVAVQTAGLPAALAGGIGQYVFPEVTRRDAVAVPLDLDAAGVAALRERGVSSVYTVGAEDAVPPTWRDGGFAPAVAETVHSDDMYGSLTFRVAGRWREGARGIDLCEPVTASGWLPFAVREGRLIVCGEGVAATCERLAPLAVGMGDSVVHGRYGGGPLGVPEDDEEYYPLFRRGLSLQVIEPGRPALSVFSAHPSSLPQPAQSPYDAEPSDAELSRWADKGKILLALVTHSGELSHDDAVTSTLDLAAAMGMPLGIGTHAQRYRFDPDCVEPLHVPRDEGGVLGQCEPVLHSDGFGIVAESLAPPEQIAARMRAAREQIAAVAGERFAPRGVLPYLDATPGRWHERPEALWRAIQAAGFEYVLSSVAQGRNRVLYRDGDFVVLNLCGVSKYPFSPFMRVDRVSQLLEMERLLSVSPGPSWMVGVLDIPLYGYTPYLSLGDLSRGVRLGEFFEYALNGGPTRRQLPVALAKFSGGETGRVVAAMPHVVARYAKLIDDRERAC